MRGLFDFMVGKPGRITRLGECLGFIGLFLSLASLFSRMPGLFQGTLDGSYEYKSMSALFPNWPLWWLPESGAAIALVLMICVAGLYIRALGHKVDSLYGYNHNDSNFA